MAKCSQCKRKVDTVRSATKNGEVISNACDSCLTSFSGYADFSRKGERAWQRREFAKDIIQPHEKEEYIKAYPEQARKHGYTDEDFRKYG